MELDERIQQVRRRIEVAALRAGRDPASITLCAASKSQTDASIRAAVVAGVSVFGENRVQELTAHLEANAYAGAREVHFIGHLQTNKVNKVVGRVALIHSVDSVRLLQAIEAQAAKLALIQDILIEVNISGEQTKGGVAVRDLHQFVALAANCPHVRLRGLMALPPAPSVSGGNMQYFVKLRQLYVDIQEKMNDNKTDINCLSMGMSRDFEDAVACGSTLLRIGTALFGSRLPVST